MGLCRWTEAGTLPSATRISYHYEWYRVCTVLNQENQLDINIMSPFRQMERPATSVNTTSQQQQQRHRETCGQSTKKTEACLL